MSRLTSFYQHVAIGGDVRHVRSLKNQDRIMLRFNTGYKEFLLVGTDVSFNPEAVQIM